jgi:hypothetical protein
MTGDYLFIRQLTLMRFSCGAAISIQAEGKKFLEKHAVAPSAVRLC